MFKLILVSALVGLAIADVSHLSGHHHPVHHPVVHHPVVHHPVVHHHVEPVKHVAPVHHEPHHPAPVHHHEPHHPAPVHHHEPHHPAPVHHPAPAPHHASHGSHDDVHAEVKAAHQDVRHDGFDSALETTNGISSHASGDEHGNIHGDFGWISPEGEHVDIKYVADEHGYQPQGHWVPTPPPTPEAILKSLEYIKAHPYHEPEHVVHHHVDHHDHHGHH